MEVNYVCSFGDCCHTAIYLKNNNLKLVSYPFDWIFSSENIIIDCIEDNFKTFLDKSQYITISQNRCGHAKYNKNGLWWHHNPLINKEHYSYYIRCIIRFKKLMIKKQHKLFILGLYNKEISDENKKKIIDFNEKLSKYTKNYTLLTIFNPSKKEENYHHFSYHDNIHFLELHTKTATNGIMFGNKEDNYYFDRVIKENYTFNLKTDIV